MLAPTIGNWIAKGRGERGNNLRIRRKYDYDREQYDRGKRGLEGDMRRLPWFGGRKGWGHGSPWEPRIDFGWEDRGRPPKRERDPIKEMYREILQREADEEGFDYWSDELSSGDMTLDEIRNAISNSSEAQELQESGRSLRDDVLDPDRYTNWHDMEFPPQVVPFDQGPKEPMRSPGIRRLQKQLQIQPDR
tara:strand:+ start:87 stop:659 length:573 start_codon:yes stop_codon:yes gene_type:complete